MTELVEWMSNHPNFRIKLKCINEMTVMVCMIGEDGRMLDRVIMPHELDFSMQILEDMAELFG